MIDEKVLIEKLFNLRWDFVRDDLQLQWNRAIDKVVHVIQEQPTSDGWIPVSSGEKPKNDEYYIITTNDGLVECAHRDNRRWYTEEATCGWYSDNEILAYMPLPPAYKESKDVF